MSLLSCLERRPRVTARCSSHSFSIRRLARGGLTTPALRPPMGGMPIARARAGNRTPSLLLAQAPEVGLWSRLWLDPHPLQLCELGHSRLGLGLCRLLLFRSRHDDHRRVPHMTRLIATIAFLK